MQVDEPIQPARGVGRRQFMRWLMGFSAVSTIAIIVTPLVGFLIPPKSSGAGSGGKLLVGTIQDIPPGTGQVVPVGSSPAVVVNTEQGVRAYSAVCTHLGCVVAWDPVAVNIVCPCHDGRFNPTNGSVLSGPPPAPLPSLQVAVEGDEIFIVSA